MKKAFAEIKKLLKRSRTILVASHIDPDGDSIGSLLSLGMVLERYGKTVTLYCEDRIPKVYAFLPNAEKIVRDVPSFQHYDLCFIVDSSEITRIGKKINPHELANKIINIDHHPDNKYFGDINYVRASSATAEEIFELARFLKIELDKNIADCLYTAIITDTGNFRYENTSRKTFRIAADLLKSGVKTNELTTMIYDTRSIASIRVCGRILSNIKLSADKKVIWAIVTEEMMRETGAEGEDLIGVVDRLRSVAGVEVAVFFRVKEGKVKINFRSKDKANVSEIARHFGGGGHIRAAGVIIDGEIGKIEEQVIAEVIKHV